MARSIPLIQASERAVLPGRLPDENAAAPAIAVAQAAGQVQASVTGLVNTFIAGQKEEKDRLGRIQTQAQVNAHRAQRAILNTELSDDIGDLTEDDVGSEQARGATAARLEADNDARMDQWRSSRSTTDDAEAMNTAVDDATRDVRRLAINLSLDKRAENFALARADDAGSAQMTQVDSFNSVIAAIEVANNEIYTEELYPGPGVLSAKREAHEKLLWRSAIGNAQLQSPLDAALLARKISKDVDPVFRQKMVSETAAALREHVALVHDSNTNYIAPQTTVTASSATTAPGTAEAVEAALEKAPIGSQYIRDIANGIAAKELKLEQGKDLYVATQPGGLESWQNKMDEITKARTKLVQFAGTMQSVYEVWKGNGDSPGPHSEVFDEALDLFYDKMRGPVLANIAPHRFPSEYVRDVKRFTYSPNRWQKLLDTKWRSQDIKEQIAAATAYGELANQPGKFFVFGEGPMRDEGQILSNDAQLAMLMVHELVVKGRVPEIEHARVIETVLKIVGSKTQKEMAKIRARIIEEAPLDPEGTTQTVMDGFVDTYVPFEAAVGVEFPRRMMQQFEDLTQYYQVLNDGSSRASANLMAWNQTKTLWGLTDDGNPQIDPGFFEDLAARAAAGPLMGIPGGGGTLGLIPGGAPALLRDRRLRWQFRSPTQVLGIPDKDVRKQFEVEWDKIRVAQLAAGQRGDAVLDKDISKRIFIYRPAPRVAGQPLGWFVSEIVEGVEILTPDPSHNGKQMVMGFEKPPPDTLNFNKKRAQWEKEATIEIAQLDIDNLITGMERGIQELERTLDTTRVPGGHALLFEMQELHFEVTQYNNLRLSGSGEDLPSLREYIKLKAREIDKAALGSQVKFRTQTVDERRRKEWLDRTSGFRPVDDMVPDEQRGSLDEGQ